MTSKRTQPTYSLTGLGYNRLLTFVLATVLGGLLQLWIVVLIVTIVKGQAIDIGKLLGDGGLLFFATSVLVASILLLMEKGDLRRRAADRNVLLLSVIIFVTAVVVYASVVPDHLVTSQPQPAPFAKLVWPQLLCSVGALALAFFVGVRTGQFKK